MSASAQTLQDRSVAWILGAGIAVTLLVALAERVSNPYNMLWVLYLAPIGFVTWYAGGRWGLATAVLSFIPVAVWPERFGDLGGNGIFDAEFGIRLAITAGCIYFTHQGRAAYLRAKEEVRTDPSTGLANAKALFDLVAIERERAERYGRPFTIAYVGIDNLPAVRLRAGTDAVDHVLRAIALQIRASIRSVDYVARLRDREFALLLPETDADAATIVMNRVRNVLSETLERDRYDLTFSIGVVTWRQSTMSVDTLHQRTYQLMYAARHEADPIRHEVLEDLIAAGADPADRRRR